jgi:ketosteroid isomerase-like protein
MMKAKFQLTILLGMVVLMWTSCTAPAAKTVDLAKAKVDIQKMEDAYAAAEKAKDAEAVVAYYSDDAVSYNRNEEPVSGKAAIKARLADRLAKDTSGNMSIYKVVDLYADGNMAVEIGSWTVKSPAGVETKKGAYMSCFQLRDGKYQCVRDMNVSHTKE